MRQSIAEFLPSKNKVYRFGIYGQTEAGKTCFLAALGLPKVAPNPAWHAITRCGLLEEHARPKDYLAEVKTNPVAAFYHGHHLMSLAENALQRGERPHGTTKDVPSLLLYFVTDQQKGQYSVELIDHAGELANDGLYHVEDNLTKTLEEHLLQMEALLLLIPAPKPGQEKTVSIESKRNDLLLRCLARVLEKRKGNPMPVALLLSKWDRRPGQNDTAEARQHQLDELLACQPPAICQAMNLIANAVGADNFKVFPVSAFGEADGEQEKPKQGGVLASFALEDAFVWAAQRCDSLAVESYQKTVTHLNRWYNRLNVSLSWQAAKEAETVLKQLPAKGEQREAIAWPMLHRVQAIARGGTIAALCMVALLLGEWLMLDRPGLQWAAQTLDSPDATTEQRTQAEQWYKSYGSSPWWRHQLSQWVLMSKDNAAKTLREKIEGEEDKAWGLVTEQKTPQDRYAPAKAYQKKYGENGRYRIEAERIVAKAEDESAWGEVLRLQGPAKVQAAHRYLEERLEGAHREKAKSLLLALKSDNESGVNESHLSRIKGRLDLATQEKNENVTAYKELLEQLHVLPFPQAETPDVRQKRMALAAEIEMRMADVAKDAIAQKETIEMNFVERMARKYEAATSLSGLASLDEEWENRKQVASSVTLTSKRSEVEKIRSERRTAIMSNEEFDQWQKKYQEAMNQREFKEAGKLLSEAETKWPTKIKGTIETYNEQIVSILTKAENEAAENDNWQRALETYNKALEVSEVLNHLTSETKQRLRANQQNVKERWGEWSYNRARRAKTEKTLRAYLDEPSADQRMKEYVREYLEYLQWRSTEQKLKLTATISWGDWWKTVNNSLLVYQDDGRVYRDDGVYSEKDKDVTIEDITCKMRPDTSSTLEVRLWYAKSRYGYTPPAGIATVKGLPEELNGQTLELDEWEGGKPMGAKVKITISGLKEEPSLPVWGTTK
jgi:hypothetical protein